MSCPHSDIINNQHTAQVFYIRYSMIWCLTDQRDHIILSWFMFPLHCVICQLGLNDLNYKHPQGNEFPKFPFEYSNNNNFVLLFVLKKNVTHSCISSGVKAASAYGWEPYHLHMPIV